ncbi:MAG: hypothetical protein JXA77_04310 [Bacteroidales bacterium]|nr:hypothetical protein [Bacteroidales bacterium]MBN2819777.1 hypothetical protein [Bacteroidales bacterium]
MKNKLHRILALLILMIIFPVALVTYYEYSSINENEELISRVYKNQLESIISSVNSYIQDIADNWISRLENSLGAGNQADSSSLYRLVNENPAIKAVYTASNSRSIQKIYSTTESYCLKDSILHILHTKKNDIEQIKTYYLSNYQRILSHRLSDSAGVLFFVSGNEPDSPELCFIEINIPSFLRNQVRPRMESIAEDNFIISLYNNPVQQVLVSTEKELTDNIEYELEGKLWLFPEINIKIALKSETINDWIKQRARQGMFLLALVLVVLLTGIFFLYISIRREIQLAQIKSEFISNVSHEIRTPLALISM